jgi:hypothetical protein
MNPKSPSLEVISTDGTSTDERRRVPRLNLTHEQFRLDGGKVFLVSDLSEGGMALRLLESSDRGLFPPGAMLNGTLNIHGERVTLRARVKHVGQELIGCQFHELDDRTVAKLKDLFDPKRLGQDLRPIPTQEDGPLWYHGMSGTDVLLWRQMDGRYHRFMVYVLGSYVQWEEEKPVVTGRVASAFERSEVWGVVRFETQILSPDPRPDAGKLSVAKTLLLSSNLPQELKKWCGRQLS